MIVDFDPIKHRYTNINTNERYISVTQFLERYINKFDANYWAEYKAIERIITENIGKDAFTKWKRSIGGHKKVIKSFYAQAQKANIDKVPLYMLQVKQEWKQKNEISCKEGSDFHEDKEAYWKGQWIHMFKNKFRKYRTQESANAVTKTIEDGIYTELRLWSEYYKIAGHADLPIIENPYVDINDYKTNLKLEFDNYCDPETGHQMMKGCLSHLKDCNGIHYNLQLSLYATLVNLQYGLEPRHLQIDYALRDFTGKFTGKVQHIPLQYMGEEVSMMLRDRELELYE